SHVMLIRTDITSTATAICRAGVTGFSPYTTLFRSKRQAGLRLDNSEGAYAVLASGHRAIAPGNFQGSALVQRVTSRTMPPPASSKKLNDPQIGIRMACVQQGRNDGQHWAFVTPKRP